MRPASQMVVDMMVVRVMYLLELRVRLIEKMLTDFTDGVDIYLGLHRDALPKKLGKLEVEKYGYVVCHTVKFECFCDCAFSWGG